jgi:D-glycero-D-manno-heptose 1,7-bisphosphate phosphatase
MNSNPAAEFSDARYIFLDRDGVLNRKPPEGSYVTSWREFEWLPEAPAAIAELNRSGRKLILVTNQGGVARGLHSLDDLARMHDQMRSTLFAAGGHLDAIYICPHADGECNCRKPLPGLFERAFRDFPDATNVNSIMIGDSWRDIEAGARLGMRTVFITDTTALPAAEAKRAAEMATVCASSLSDFVRRYCRQEPGI